MSPHSSEPSSLRRGSALGSIPVLRPNLPSAERILPYLQRIDATRVYTNWGPLAGELEHKLATQFGVEDGGVVSASSGTSALVGAVLATAGRATNARPIAVLPAFTFVATAVAVQQCGYQPYLVDVSPETWLLESTTLEGHPMLAHAGIIVPVAAFGRPVAPEAWLALRSQTGIPVVIDGAACFETLSMMTGSFASAIPVSVSFHATKTFATGEGGCVVTTDSALAERVVRALNFGFLMERESRSASTNGKMSEYHAAVGLAALECWPSAQAALRDVATAYQEELDTLGLGHRLVCAPSVAGCYVLFCCSGPDECARVQHALRTGDVEFRMWYGGGLHEQPHFAHLPRDPLLAADRLAACTIGLPVAVDLPRADIRRVVSAIASAAAVTL